MDALTESIQKMPTMCTGLTVPLSARADAGSSWRPWVEERTTLQIWCLENARALAQTPVATFSADTGTLLLLCTWRATVSSAAPSSATLTSSSLAKARSFGQRAGVISPSLDHCPWFDDAIKRPRLWIKGLIQDAATWTGAGLPTRGVVPLAGACEACRSYAF